MARRTRGNPTVTASDAVEKYADSRGFGTYDRKAASVLMPFRAALARRNTAAVRVAVYGDSTEEGQGITPTTVDNRALSWPDRFGWLLRNKYPTDGLANFQGCGWTAARTESALATGWTNSGWVNATSFGPDSKAMRSTAAGNTLTRTLPVGVTGFDVVYVGGSSITGFTVTVDGGAPSATITQATSKDGHVYQGVRGLAPGSAHTVVITSVGTNSYFDGLILYYGTESKGINVFNLGYAGRRTPDYLPGGYLGGWMNATPGIGSFQGAQSFAALNPDIVFMPYGYNDINVPVSKAQFKANLVTLTAGLRAMIPTKTIPFVYLGKWNPDVTQWGVGKPNTYADLVAGMAEVAAADPLSLAVNLADTIPAAGSSLATAYGLYADSVHGKADAYLAVADSLTSLIAA